MQTYATTEQLLLLKQAKAKELDRWLRKVAPRQSTRKAAIKRAAVVRLDSRAGQ